MSKRLDRESENMTYFLRFERRMIPSEQFTVTWQAAVICTMGFNAAQNLKI